MGVTIGISSSVRRSRRGRMFDPPLSVTLAAVSGREGRGGRGPFTEKSFYLGEFRDRTLLLSGPRDELAKREPLEAVLADLERNPTGVVVVSSDRAVVESLAKTPVLSAPGERLPGSVGRALGLGPRVGLVVGDEGGLPAACRRLASRLGIAKLVWMDPQGGLVRRRGGPQSFVGLEELAKLLQAGVPGESPRRVALLREVETALRDGLPAVNLCTAEGLADELFTYAGSGTLFSRQRYVEVRPLGVDDFEAAQDLIARGVAEGYLAPRGPEEVDRIFSYSFGAFIEGRHLAGIGALLPDAQAGSGEIASLYALTRFVGEGVGGHLVSGLCGRARDLGLAYVFACTTTERVVGFFERNGFRSVPPDAVPAAKWRDYDPARRASVRCLRRDLV